MSAPTVVRNPDAGQPVVKVALAFDWWRMAIAVAVGIGIYLIPAPEGLEGKPWGMLALFIATIVAVIAKAMPMGAVTLLALVIGGLIGLTPITPTEESSVGMLSGFANSTIWLIGVAMLLSRAVIKTGLGKRIALFFVARLGTRMMGVVYGIAIADLIIGPGIPSASARGGGIMYPIMQSIADAYDSKPGPTARRAGAFLAIAVSQIDTIVCAMFLTAMAGNPLVAELAASQGVEISWTLWFVGAIVPGLVALVVLPYVVYKIYPPELKKTPKMAEFARDELRTMGPMSRAEWVLAGTFGLRRVPRAPARVLLHALFLRLGDGAHLRDVPRVPRRGDRRRHPAAAGCPRPRLRVEPVDEPHAVRRRPRPRALRIGLQLDRSVVGRELRHLDRVARDLGGAGRPVVQAARLVVSSRRAL